MDAMLLQGKVLMAHSTCPVADLRQAARLPHRCRNVRRSLNVLAQAASVTARQKADTETAKAEPTPSLDTTHVPIKTGKGTDPDHVADGVGSSGPNIEVDSVLAKELSENGVYSSYCSCYGDHSANSEPIVALRTAHTACVTSLQGFVVPEEPRSYVPLALSPALRKC